MRFYIQIINNDRERVEIRVKIVEIWGSEPFWMHQNFPTSVVKIEEIKIPGLEWSSFIWFSIYNLFSLIFFWIYFKIV